MGFDVGQPTVVISDTPPPTVQCRNLQEVAACEQLLQIMRRKQDPILFVTRLESGEHEVHARSGRFPSLKRAEEICQEIKVKLMDSLIRKKVPLALGALTLALMALFAPAQAQQRTDELGVTVTAPAQSPKKNGMKGTGVLKLEVSVAGKPIAMVSALNAWPNSGEQYLVDSWRGLQTLSNARYHALGTSATAFAETQTACVAEFTGEYQTDNQRAQGTLAVGASPNVFRTVGTNVIDIATTVREFCLMTAQTVGTGVAITRILVTPTAVPANATVTTTYEVTFE